ncbi:MAG: amidohydrolase family protein [Gemmatimonadaceae bacterium]|nr:amidohydrolase family protein [Gemmatimonadaceae bacterium]
MIRHVGAALLIVMCGCAERTDRRDARAGEPACATAIVHVTVIDVDLGSARPDQTVLLCGRHVGTVDRADRVSTTPTTRLIDGRGRFLIPGLWDSHVHAFSMSFAGWLAPLMLANGVTSVRDMGDYVDTALAARRAVASGAVPGPRLLVSLRLDGPDNTAPWVRRASSTADGVAAVRAARDTGLDFVKVYSDLPRDAYFGAAAEARRLGFPIDGHVPYSIGVAEAIASGQRTIEHEDDLMRACSSQDTLLRRRLRSRRTAGHDELTEVREQSRLMRAHPAERRCDDLLRAMVLRGTALVPTLGVYQPYAHHRDAQSPHPERDRFVPAGLRRMWARRVSQTGDADTLVAQTFFSAPRTLRAHRLGVRLLAGTDTPLPDLVPGFSLHDELELLVAAGLSSADALRSATLLPARVFAMSDSLGTISEGMLADLVLLDADPLADIGNARRIRLVVANGRVFDRAALDAMLHRAARFASP